MARSYTHGGKYPAPNERFGLCGVFERKKRTVGFSKMGKYEICVPKPRILVQGILRGHRGEEQKGN